MLTSSYSSGNLSTYNKAPQQSYENKYETNYDFKKQGTKKENVNQQETTVETELELDITALDYYASYGESRASN